MQYLSAIANLLGLAWKALTSLFLINYGKKSERLDEAEKQLSDAQESQRVRSNLDSKSDADLRASLGLPDNDNHK